MKTLTKKVDTAVGDVYVSYRMGRNPLHACTVVFVHGWGSNHEVWKEARRSCGAATLTLDLPGFGRSDTPTESLSVAAYADVLEEVIEKCELTDVVLVGHSFGGQIATALAARQPVWLSGLMLVGSASLRNKKPPLLSRIGEKIGPVFRLPVLRHLRPLLYKAIGADVPPENAVMQETMRRILRDDQRHQLSDITVPTQLVWGGLDRSTPLAEGEEIARRIPRSSLTVLSGGHYIFLDQPTAFADILSSYLKQLS